MITALIAVAGTLLGSIVTHYFQRASAHRAIRQSFSERLRQDRLSAYNAFAAAAIEYRHHQIERWHRLRQDPGAELNSRSEAFSQKAALKTEFLRVKLLSDDSRLHRLADEAIEAIRGIQRTGVAACDAEEHEQRYLAATAAIDAFVQYAANDVQTLPAVNAKAVGSASQ
ncbi:hypothetical protein ACQP1O_17410 [Nocardia sp. CA-151230]|uniref:hypothetical protein n=1 Tax=Nocardia sp. CA-151230 TaxID=3239982 RepID=UPI003D913099